MTRRLVVVLTVTTCLSGPPALAADPSEVPSADYSVTFAKYADFATTVADESDPDCLDTSDADGDGNTDEVASVTWMSDPEQCAFQSEHQLHTRSARGLSGSDDGTLDATITDSGDLTVNRDILAGRDVTAGRNVTANTLRGNLDGTWQGRSLGWVRDHATGGAVDYADRAGRADNADYSRNADTVDGQHADEIGAIQSGQTYRTSGNSSSSYGGGYSSYSSTTACDPGDIMYGYGQWSSSHHEHGHLNTSGTVALCYDTN